MKNYYEVLGVSKQATGSEIKKAFKALMLEKLSQPDMDVFNKEMAVFREIYEMLVDEHAKDDLNEEINIFESDFDDLNPAPVLRLSETEVPLSEEFKKEHQQLQEKVEDTSTLQTAIYGPFCLKPKNSFYFSEWDKDNVTNYDNLFLYIKAKSEEFHDDRVEYKLPNLLTPNAALMVLTRFLNGDYYGHNLKKLQEHTGFTIDRLTLSNKANPAISFYQALLNLFGMVEVAPIDNQLLLVLTEISTYAQTVEQEDRMMFHELFRSEAYRLLFQHASFLSWQAEPSDLQEKLKLLNGKEKTRVILRYFLFLKDLALSQNNSELVKTFDHQINLHRILYRFEDFFDRHEESTSSASSYRILAYKAIDWVNEIAPIANLMALNTILRAGLYFQHASLLEDEPSLSMADEAIATKLYIKAYELSKNQSRYAQIYVQSHALANCSVFFSHSELVEFRSALSSEIIKTFSAQQTHLYSLQTETLSLIDRYPFHQALQSNAECVDPNNKTQKQIGEFLKSKVELIKYNDLNSFLIDQSDPKITLLKEAYLACLEGWYANSEFPEVKQEIRLALMTGLLDQAGWTLLDLQKNMDIPWSLMNQTPEGWMQPTTSSFVSSQNSEYFFNSFDGFQIDYNTGEITVLASPYQPDDPTSQPLLTQCDLNEIIANDLIFAQFSLEGVNLDLELDDPFCRMVFAPPSLASTGLLATFFLTDYLLKMFIVGCQVQGRPPYNLDNIDSIVSQLPKPLKKAIDKFYQSPNQEPSIINRSWIEAEQVNFGTSIEEQEEVMRYALGDTKISIKTRKLELQNDRLVEISGTEGWPVYILDNEAPLQAVPITIPSPALVLVSHQDSTAVSAQFLENGKCSKRVELEFNANLDSLFLLPRDEQGLVLGASEHLETIYPVTNKAAKAIGKSHRFSPVFVLTYKLTKHYALLEETFPSFARMAALLKTMALVNLMKEVYSTVKNRFEIDKLQEDIQEFKNGIGAFPVDLFSPEVNEIIQQHVQIKQADFLKDVAVQLGQPGQPVNINNLSPQNQMIINNQMANIANQIESLRQECAQIRSANKRNDVRNEFIRVFGESDVDQLVTPFLEGNMEPVFEKMEQHWQKQAVNEPGSALDSHKKHLKGQTSKAERLIESFEKLGFGRAVEIPDLSNTLMWVPACLNQNKRHRDRAYGGCDFTRYKLNYFPLYPSTELAGERLEHDYFQDQLQRFNVNLSSGLYQTDYFDQARNDEFFERTEELKRRFDEHEVQQWEQLFHLGGFGFRGFDAFNAFHYGDMFGGSSNVMQIMKAYQGHICPEDASDSIYGDETSSSCDSGDSVWLNEFGKTLLQIGTTKSDLFNTSSENIHPETTEIINQAITDNFSFFKELNQPQYHEEKVDINIRLDSLLDSYLGGTKTESVEHTLESIHFDPILAEDEFNKAFFSAFSARGEQGVDNFVSEEPGKKISTQGVSSLLQTIKAGGEAGAAAVMNILGPEFHGGVFNMLSDPNTRANGLTRAYLHGNSLLFTFSMNLPLVALEGSDSLIKDATFATAGDVVFNMVLSRTLGYAAGPVGWAIMGVQIADTLFYDPKLEEQLENIAEDFRREVIQGDGSLFEKYGMHAIASDHMRIANELKIFHQLAEGTRWLGELIGDNLKWVWDKSQNYEVEQERKDTDNKIKL